MTVQQQATVAPVDRPGLAAAVQDALADAGAAVVGIDVAMSPYSTSFRIEDVTATLADGSQRALILKDLSWDTMLEGARGIRDHEGHDPRREADVYARLLPHAPAGPPMLLGHVDDAASGGHWLLLERIEGLQLRHVGERDVWLRAMSWAGAFHAEFARPERLAAAAEIGLPTWDAERLRLSMAQAEHAHPGPAMKDVAKVHERVVARLAGAAPTVVHGQLYPSNIVVADRPEPRRVAALDWETAAIGAGVLDLAALVEGDWTPADRTAFVTAYLQGAGGADLESTLLDLACARLHLCLELLGLPAGFDPPADVAADWLDRAVSLTKELPW
jgi:hypothetical protein